MKYRRKPVIVEAVQYDGTAESVQRINKMIGGSVISHTPDVLYLVTLSKGVTHCNTGGYVILENGYVDVCGQHEFEFYYEPAD